MTRVAIVDADLFGDIATQLVQEGHSATPLRDIASLKAWLDAQENAVLLLSQPANSSELSAATSDESTSGKSAARWSLNAAQLELITPDGKPVPLTPNECRILQAAARANGKLVSRQTLVESMGISFLHYDERRLEALISRLRRKLSAFIPDGFPVRGVKGCGYLFCIRLRETGDITAWTD